jgi:hypothetical protein
MMKGFCKITKYYHENLMEIMDEVCRTFDRIYKMHEIQEINVCCAD